MKVVIIPSDSYCFNESPLRGIFQKDLFNLLSSKNLSAYILSPQPRSLRYIFSTKIFSNSEIENVFRNQSWDLFPRCQNIQNRIFLSVGMNMFSRINNNFGPFDLIHAHNVSNAGILARKINEEFNVPYIITEHSSKMIGNNFSNHLKREIKKSYNASRKVIAVSSYLAEKISENYSAKNLTVIPNFLPSEFASPAKLCKSKNKIIFLNVGSIDENKNQINLIKAFSEISSKYSQIYLKFIGSGPQFTKAKNLVRKLNINEFVTFYGNKNRHFVKQLLTESSALIISSRVETFGVAALEALSTGTPVISTPCGGTKDFINNQNSLMSSGFSPDSLKKTMIEFIEKADKFNNLSIQQTFFKNYSNQDILKNILEIYKHSL